MKFDGSEEQMEIIRSIANDLLDPVFLVDKNFNVWFFNRTFESTVGVRMSSRRYQGLPCYKLLGLDICENACVMRKAVETKQNVRLAEIGGTPASGERKNFHINAIPLENDKGNAFGALIFLRDITAETQIQEKYKRLVAKNSNIALSGQIEDGNLPDIIQLLSFLQKTGQLTLKRGEDAGDMVFEGGQMKGVRYAGLSAAKAFGRILAWEGADFSFSPKVTAEETSPIEGSADFLLMDALRERDELNAKKADIPGPEVVPQVARAAQPDSEELEQLERLVYGFAFSGHTVADIVETLSEPDSRVLLSLVALREKGFLSW